MFKTMAGDSESAFVCKALATELEKQEDCDVMFILDGQTIGGHKLLLKVMQARCGGLYEMAKGWHHGDEPISIEMTFEAFKVLLRYIYTDEITITNEDVFTFLSAAVHFEMHHLEELCVAHISKLLCTQNLCHFMNEAIDFKSTALEDECREMFSNQTSEILWADSFLQLQQPALSGLLDVETTNALEIEIFYHVEKWMTTRCNNQHLPINGENMRDVIGDALYKIRFPTMNSQDFANAVSTIKGFLTESEIVQIFQKIMVFDNKDIECPFSDTFRCQVSHYSQPFDEMFQLLTDTMLNSSSIQWCTLREMFKEITKMKNGDLIVAHSLRLVMQCCADLANCYGLCEVATVNNKTNRTELLRDFDSWLQICKTKNSQITMTKYMELRTKFNEICAWGR